MTREVQVTVAPDGEISARSDRGAYSPVGAVQVAGVDGDLIRVFERWLQERDRVWRLQEIAAFGALLHRALFPDPIWRWIERQMAELEKDERLRLQLALPDAGLSFLAAVPWEYLRVPDRSGRDGYFLATHRRLLLARYIPMETGRTALAPLGPVRLLAIASEPREPFLGEVVAEPVMQLLRSICGEAQLFELSELQQPTRSSLAHTMANFRPHVVHFMGHGEYSEEAEQGRLAFVYSEDQSADWVGGTVLSRLLGTGGEMPRVVVLHSCDGARVDDRTRFAGLAPRLIRAGVQCVVAMQYAVTNRMATAFSTGFYTALRSGLPVDEAVQAGREVLLAQHEEDDPGLLGVPVVYLYSSDAALLASPPDDLVTVG